MRIALQQVRAMLRSLIATCLLVCFASCYAVPATAWAKAQTANCCRGRHGSCCRKQSGAGNGAGQLLNSRADCASGCRLPAGVSPRATSLAVTNSQDASPAGHSEPLVAKATNGQRLHSYYAFLYERPPPRP